MQYLHDNSPLAGKTFSLGWKAVFFGIVTIALSLFLSIGIMQLVEPFIA